MEAMIHLILMSNFVIEVLLVKGLSHGVMDLFAVVIATLLFAPAYAWNCGRGSYK